MKRWMCIGLAVTGFAACDVVTPDPACTPDEGDLSTTSLDTTIELIRAVCPDGENTATYRVATETAEEGVGAPTVAELRVALHENNADLCPVRETYAMTESAEEDFSFEVVITYDPSADTADPAEPPAALTCASNAEFVTRALLLWDDNGNLLDCAVWGDFPEYFLSDRGYSACLDWTSDT